MHSRNSRDCIYDREYKPLRSRTKHRLHKPEFDFSTLEDPSNCETPKTPKLSLNLYSFHVARANRWWSSLSTRTSNKRQRVVQSIEFQNSADFFDEDFSFSNDEPTDYKPDANSLFKTDATTQTDDIYEKTVKRVKREVDWGFEVASFFVASIYSVLFNWFIVYPWLKSGKSYMFDDILR